MEPRLLLGASQLGWVTALTQWVAEHGGAQLVGQALTPDDVDQAHFDLLVLDGWSSLLNRRLVDRVQQTGAAVMVLVNAERPDAEAGRLRDLGVSLSLPLSASPDLIVSRGAEVAAVRRVNGRPHPAAPTATLPDQPSDTHRLLVVTGTGGVTEVTAHLAAASARLGQSTVLVDLNTVTPSIAQRLDLPLVPNLLTVCEEIRRSRLDPDGMLSHPAGFKVVSGLANPREWDELTTVDTGELLAGLEDSFQVTLAVVHPLLEELAPLSGLEGRFDTGRRTIEKADEVLVVATPSPVGVVHALGAIADIRSLTSVPIHVAVNRVPKSRFVADQWAEELTRLFTPASLSFLPTDVRVNRAAWDGRLALNGPFSRQIRHLADGLVRVWP